jgi:hypothetical protein
MPRRIEVELTSVRDDGTWTWRAAGARQPKGELDGGLLPAGAKVGDVLRAEADFDVDGITVVAVLPPKGGRKEPERLELIGPPTRDDQFVTTQLAPKGRGERRGRDDRDRGDRRERRERQDGGRPGEGRRGGPAERRDRARREGPPGERRERPTRPPRPAPEAKPKPKRLRPGRAHRNAVLAELPEEQKPIAEQVLKGGIPAVRQAVQKQNEENKAAGQPEVAAEPLVTLAEQLLPRLRAAEWHDRAEAALGAIDDLDLRDLRSVVVAADAAARDDETRALAGRLREGLTRRVEEEHRAWLSEIDETVRAGRVVRALRLSSRPPKAGTPFPPELGARLAEATSANLTAETAPDRFATVLDALAYAPVRATVEAQGLPATPSPELMALVTKLASRIPKVAAQFGVEAPPPPTRGAKGRRPRSGAPVPPPPALPKAPAAAAIEAPPPTPAIEATTTDTAPTAAIEATTTDTAPTAAIEATTPDTAPTPAPTVEEGAPDAPEAPASAAGGSTPGTGTAEPPAPEGPTTDG